MTEKVSGHIKQMKGRNLRLQVFDVFARQDTLCVNYDMAK